MLSTITPFSVVFDMFFSMITDDMFMELTEEDTKQMVEKILLAAIPWFEFPRIPLDYTEGQIVQTSWVKHQTGESGETEEYQEGYFHNCLNDEEIKILATYMVTVWIGYQLASVENVREKYSGTDFKFTSQANHMQKLNALQKDYERKGFHLQRLYSRRKKDTNGQYRPTFKFLMTEPDSWAEGSQR